MLSESARMSSAAEARFRVQAPNSKPRAIKVIALDAASEPVLQRLAGVPSATGQPYTIAPMRRRMPRIGTIARAGSVASSWPNSVTARSNR